MTTLCPSLLRPYQREISSRIVGNPNYAIFCRMGGGKTVSTLTALNELFDRFEIGRVLIISTVRNIRATWPNQIHAWEHTQDLQYSVVYGTPKQRLKALRVKADIYTISLESLVWLCQQYTVKTWPFDCVVIDESSKFKDQSTKRFKTFRKMLPAIDRMVLLTGTPATAGLMGLWSQMFLLDRGERLGRTITNYRKSYFDPDYMGFNWAIKPGAEKTIHEKISDICITIDPREHMTTLEPVFNDVLIPLPENLRKQYKELEREFLLELGGETVVANNAAVLSSKLRQFCNGAMYVDENRNWMQLHDLKLDALEEVIEDANGMPVLLAYEFVFDRERILKRFPDTVQLDSNPETIKRFNDGEIPLLMMHPKSGGHGLDLQHGTNITVWFGMQWSLELYEQFNERAGPTRQAQAGYDRPAYYHHIMIADSIEQSVQERLGKFSGDQNRLLDALKKDIEQRLEKVA